ncbi:MAG: TRAM domain-containing protein [Candidatus Bathyarchaeia archaeon]
MFESKGPQKRFGRRFNKGQRFSKAPCPVKEGEEYEVTVEAVGRKGDGIARIENFVIFVPGAKAGDKLKVRVTGIRGTFATAEVVTGE